MGCHLCVSNFILTIFYPLTIIRTCNTVQSAPAYSNNFIYFGDQLSYPCHFFFHINLQMRMTNFLFSDNNYTDPNNPPFEISHMLYISWIWYFIDTCIILHYRYIKFYTLNIIFSTKKISKGDIYITHYNV